MPSHQAKRYVYRGETRTSFASLAAYGLAALEPARTPRQHALQTYPHRREELLAGISPETIAAQEEGLRVPPVETWRAPRIYAFETFDAFLNQAKSYVPTRFPYDAIAPVYDDGTMGLGTVYGVFTNAQVGQGIVDSRLIEIQMEGEWVGLNEWLSSHPAETPLVVHTDDSEPILDLATHVGIPLVGQSPHDATPFCPFPHEQDAIAASSHFGRKEWDAVERSRIRLETGGEVSSLNTSVLSGKVGESATFRTILSRGYGGRIFSFSALCNGRICVPKCATTRLDDFFVPDGDNHVLSELRQSEWHPRNCAFRTMRQAKSPTLHERIEYWHGPTWLEVRREIADGSRKKPNPWWQLWRR